MDLAVLGLLRPLRQQSHRPRQGEQSEQCLLHEQRLKEMQADAVLFGDSSTGSS